MCLEKIHRFMMASVLSIGAYFISQNAMLGQYILWFVIGMLTMFAVFNFCPSVWMMEKLGIKSCANKTDKEES